MAIIWTIEDPIFQKQKLSDRLSMDYPVRKIATIESFARLLGLEDRTRYPQLVIVNDAVTEDDMCIFACCKLLMAKESDFLTIVSESSSSPWNEIASQSGLPRVHLTTENPILLKQTIDRMLSFFSKPVTLTPTVAYAMQKTCIEFGDVILETTSRELVINGRVRDVLSPKEQKILEILSLNLNSCVLRTTLVHFVWPKVKVSDRTIDSHISRLRGKLSGSAECQLESVYGQGYCLRLS